MGPWGPWGLVHMQISDLRESGCSYHLAFTREPHRRCRHHCLSRAPKELHKVECGFVVGVLCWRVDWWGSLRYIRTRFPSQVEGLLHSEMVHCRPALVTETLAPVVACCQKATWTSGCGGHLKRFQSFPWAWGRGPWTSLQADELIHSPQQSKYTQNQPTGRITVASKGQ